MISLYVSRSSVDRRPGARGAPATPRIRLPAAPVFSGIQLGGKVQDDLVRLEDADGLGDVLHGDVPDLPGVHESFTFSCTWSEMRIDPARGGLQAGGDVHRVAQDVSLRLAHHLAAMDPDADHHPGVLVAVAVEAAQGFLQADGGKHGGQRLAGRRSCGRPPCA